MKKILVSPSFLKQKARQFKKEKSLSQHQALDEASKFFGFTNYKHYLNSLDVKHVEHDPKIYNLPRLTSGRALVELIAGSQRFQIEHDESDDQRAIGAMKGIVNGLKGDIVGWYDGDDAIKEKFERYMSKAIQELESFGFYLFGIKRKLPELIKNQSKETTMCTIYLSHARSKKIGRDESLNLFVPALLPSVAR